jgi:N-acetylneuraminic acid mutarotase
VGGRLVAIGGRMDGDPDRNLAVTEIYDPATDSWRTGAPMPTARSGAAAAVLGGAVFVMGGESHARTFGAVEAYDPARDAWTRRTPLPTPRHGFGAIVQAGRIHTLVGSPNPGGDRSDRVEVLDPEMHDPEGLAPGDGARR